ncbi:MAG: HD domain-containing protein [Proteobacteria bacterium]|nr:HD domain-containing protein [Pseudomonadota bacterium]
MAKARNSQMKLLNQSPEPETGVTTTSTKSGSDPLTAEQAKELLTPVDHIRDPLHGDIRLTALERFLIDQPEFQRLRNINQLAMTYIAYPGALHTRFLHALGTLHVCADMIATCNRNAEIYRSLAGTQDVTPLRVTSYANLLARMCALLHDLAHVPFGHTLEKEARIFAADEWQDENRRERLLGKKSRLAQALREWFENNGLPSEAASELLGEVKRILETKLDSVEDLRYPFVHDIVGNTICADLIDYVQRDSYFCGLDERFGTRFLSYLAVMPVQRELDNKDGEMQLFPTNGIENFATVKRKGIVHCCRLVLLQYRYNEKGVPITKHDIIAEAIDLVRRRLGVAEKLYFHRTKMAASAMLTAAAYAHGLKAEDIFDLSDSEMIKMLESSQNPRASRLANKIRDRKLLKPIYTAAYHSEDDSHEAHVLWNSLTGAYPRYSDPKHRDKLIERLEALIGRVCCGRPEDGIGTVAMSCPDKDMNLKAIDMLVLPAPTKTITRLQDSDYRSTQQEIAAIQNTHRHLWKLEVFVDPDVVPLKTQNTFTRELAGAITHEIGPRNQVLEFATVPTRNLDDLETQHLVDSEVASLGLSDKITHSDREQLLQMSLREGRDSSEQVRQYLKEKGYSI